MATTSNTMIAVLRLSFADARGTWRVLTVATSPSANVSSTPDRSNDHPPTLSALTHTPRKRCFEPSFVSTRTSPTYMVRFVSCGVTGCVDQPLVPAQAGKYQMSSRQAMGRRRQRMTVSCFESPPRSHAPVKSASRRSRPRGQHFLRGKGRGDRPYAATRGGCEPSPEEPKRSRQARAARPTMRWRGLPSHDRRSPWSRTRNRSRRDTAPQA